MLLIVLHCTMSIKCTSYVKLNLLKCVFYFNIIITSEIYQDSTSSDIHCLDRRPIEYILLVVS